MTSKTSQVYECKMCDYRLEISGAAARMNHFIKVVQLHEVDHNIIHDGEKERY